ncbi:MAG: GH-E family nuclease [Alphaproteobacteria bacterium]
MTQKQFNDRMNNPNKYQLEEPSSNRSRRFECAPPISICPLSTPK